jgi:hypothetical protein
VASLTAEIICANCEKPVVGLTRGRRYQIRRKVKAKTPVFCGRTCATTLRWRQPAHRELVAAGTTVEARRSMAENCRKVGLANRNKARSPEARKSIAATNARVWADPDRRMAQSVRLKEIGKRPELREMRSANHKKKWADPKFRRRLEAGKFNARHICYAGRVFDSSWELAAYKSLEETSPVRWSFNETAFDLGGITWLPDFVLATARYPTILELKGHPTAVTRWVEVIAPRLGAVKGYRILLIDRYAWAALPRKFTFTDLMRVAASVEVAHG